MSGHEPGVLSPTTRASARRRIRASPAAELAEVFGISLDKHTALLRRLDALSTRCQLIEEDWAAEKAAREKADERVAEAEARVACLAVEVAELRKSQQQFDISTRRASLVVHNVPESPDCDAGQALQQVCSSAGLQPLTYSEAVRLGKPPAEVGAREQARPRPVLLKFGAVQQKHDLLRQSKALREQKVYLDDDLTPHQRSMRAKLSRVFSLLKFHKRPRFWRQERLFTVFEGQLVPCDVHTVPPGCAAAAA